MIHHRQMAWLVSETKKTMMIEHKRGENIILKTVCSFHTLLKINLNGVICSIIIIFSNGVSL